MLMTYNLIIYLGKQHSFLGKDGHNIGARLFRAGAYAVA